MVRNEEYHDLERYGNCVVNPDFELLIVEDVAGQINVLSSLVLVEMMLTWPVVGNEDSQWGTRHQF